MNIRYDDKIELRHLMCYAECNSSDCCDNCSFRFDPTCDEIHETFYDRDIELAKSILEILMLIDDTDGSLKDDCFETINKIKDKYTDNWGCK